MKRVLKSLNTSLIAAAICGITVTAIVAFGAKPIIMMFLSPDSGAFGIACEGLPKFALCGLSFALNIAMIGFYQSLEQSTRATVFTLLRGIIFIVPLFLTLPLLIGTAGMWLAIPASELLTLIVIAIDFAANRHNHKAVEA